MVLAYLIAADNGETDLTAGAALTDTAPLWLGHLQQLWWALWLVLPTSEMLDDIGR